MSRNQDEHSETDASLAPFFAAARSRGEAPLDPVLASRLTAQALAAMPQATARTSRQQRRARLGDWFDRLLAPAGLATAVSAAGLAGLAIGLWTPGLDGVSGVVLGWAGAPLVEAGLPWDEDHGLMALIDGQGG